MEGGAMVEVGLKVMDGKEAVGRKLLLDDASRTRFTVAFQQLAMKQNSIQTPGKKDKSENDE
ncbi:hypothetical protein TWF481_002873 [Arthrobotrys musiformis]|uniref:Uncharacterized protein n=1 Tax=Arthrobotrys musiformis TaxID=47236 RepID=A0AAV9VSQ6_9PEZI